MGKKKHEIEDNYIDVQSDIVEKSRCYYCNYICENNDENIDICESCIVRVGSEKCLDCDYEDDCVIYNFNENERENEES